MTAYWNTPIRSYMLLGARSGEEPRGWRGHPAIPAVAQSMPEVKWRLTAVGRRRSTRRSALAKAVAEATDNKFQIQIFAAGEVVPALQALASAQTADRQRRSIARLLAADHGSLLESGEGTADDIAKTNASFKKVYDSMEAFQGAVYPGFRVAELNDDSFMIRHMA